SVVLRDGLAATGAGTKIRGQRGRCVLHREGVSHGWRRRVKGALPSRGKAGLTFCFGRAQNVRHKGGEINMAIALPPARRTDAYKFEGENIANLAVSAQLVRWGG